MKEWHIIILLTLSPLLWMVGGTCWKPARRYILPLVLSIVLACLNIVWWKIGVIAVCNMAVFSMGYGESKPWVYKFMVGCLYAIPTILLGLTIWQVVVPIIFITTFWLSNNQKFASQFTWKVCEGITGFTIGCMYSTLIALV